METKTPSHWMYERAPAFQSGTYTDIDHLLYSLVYMIIERERQRMGWLNPYARPFVPESLSQNQEIPKTEGKTQFPTKPRQDTKSDEASPHNITRTEQEIKPLTNRRTRINQWIKIPTRKGPNQVQEMKSVTGNRENTNRFKVLEDEEEYEDGEETDDEGIREPADEDDDDRWDPSDKESRSHKSNKVKNFDVEQMSTEEMEEVLTHTTKEECELCEERTEAYEGLVCEIHRVNQYAMDQEAQIEELENIHHCIQLLNYLEVNERKAQMKHIANIIEEHNIFRDEALENGQGIIKAWEDACEKNENLTTMYDKLVDDYNELLERHQNERKAKECKECRRNQSRYKSERVCR